MRRIFHGFANGAIFLFIILHRNVLTKFAKILAFGHGNIPRFLLYPLLLTILLA